MRTAGQRVTLAAQERWIAIKPLVAIRSFYGDKVAFSGSLLGYKREHPRFATSCDSRIHDDKPAFYSPLE